MNRTDSRAALFVFVLGLATILGAWAFQLVGHYVPCKLCLEERIPYYVGLPVVLVALIATRTNAPAWLPRALLAVAGLIFLYGAYLGTYHAGAEWTWWEGPSDCGSTGAINTGNLLEDLDNIRIVSCTEASWRFPDASWGLSFAGWNAVISAILAVTALLAAARGPGRAA